MLRLCDGVMGGGGLLMVHIVGAKLFQARPGGSSYIAINTRDTFKTVDDHYLNIF